MRVSDLTLTDTLAGQLNAEQAAITNLDSELSSGLALQQPSDNPVAVVDTLAYQRQSAYLGAAQTSAQSAQAWLGMANQTSNSVLDTYQSVNTMMLQALNSGSQNPQTYQALSQQLQGVMSTLVGLANTQFGGMSIFAGTANVPAPYAANGTYSGNNQTFTIQVGPGGPTPVSVPGTELFGGGATGVQSIFTTLTNAINDLAAGPSPATETALQGALSSLDANITQAQQASSVLGVAAQQVQTVSSQLTAANTQVQSVLSNTRDVNVASATTELTTEMANYQAALWASANAVPESLAQFIQ